MMMSSIHRAPLYHRHTTHYYDAATRYAQRLGGRNIHIITEGGGGVRYLAYGAQSAGKTGLLEDR